MVGEIDEDMFDSFDFECPHNNDFEISTSISENNGLSEY